MRADEIECRVGQITKDGFTLLLYKDARCDMDILDETVGADNWQRDHKEVKGNMFCGVSIWSADKNEWATKWDCGTESNTEKEKGEASDSFKRANVNWGIGRELYTSPKIKIKGHLKEYNGKQMPDFWKISVSEIGYNERREISKLTIVGDGKIIFGYAEGKRPHAPKSATEPTKQPETGTTSTTGSNKAEPCDFADEKSISLRKLEVALDYGVHGKTSTKIFREMNLNEIKACAKVDDKIIKANAKLILDALESGMAFFNESGTVDTMPF